MSNQIRWSQEQRAAAKKNGTVLFAIAICDEGLNGRTKKGEKCSLGRIDTHGCCDRANALKLIRDMVAVFKSKKPKGTPIKRKAAKANA
jgi:hypothetical protein